MALVTHGTTLAGFKAIMAGEGKASLGTAPWTVSDNDGQMYFYSAIGCYVDWHGEQPEGAVDTTPAANQSFEAARLQYAVKGLGGQVVVLVCDIPDDLLELDYSCHGDSSAMPNARAIACCDFDPAWIVDIQVANFDQWDCVPALLCVWSNELFNQGEVPERLAKLIESIGHSDDLYEGLYDYSLESVDVQEFALSHGFCISRAVDEFDAFEDVGGGNGPTICE